MTDKLTRREFSAGLLAAGTLAATGRGFAATGANERMRAGVVGCRIRGPQLAKRVIANQDLDLVAVCDCDAELRDKCARQMSELTQLPSDFATYQDFRRILDDKSIDAVFLAVPDHWHAIMTILALQAGKHVYVEKPASFNIVEGKAMAAAQKRYGKMVQVGSQQRSGEHFAEAKEFIDSGALGKIGFARAWIANDKGVVPRIPDSDPPATLDYKLWLGPVPYRPYNKNRLHYSWHYMRDTGTGYMGNWGAHWLDIVRWYLNVDMPQAVSSHGVRVIDDAKEWPDTHTVIYECPELTVLWEQRMWTDYPVAGKQCGVEFHGSEGVMFIDRQGWSFYPKNAKAKGKPTVIEHAASEEDMTFRHVNNFTQAIRGQGKLAAPIETGAGTAVWCHLGNMAATVKRRLVFDGKSQTVQGDPEAARCLQRAYSPAWPMPRI